MSGMTHIPLRMCVVCRKHLPVSELIRITYDKETDSPVPDEESKNSGRGAYICRDAQCLKKAGKKHVAERHLGCEASEALYRNLEEMI